MTAHPFRSPMVRRPYDRRTDFEPRTRCRRGSCGFTARCGATRATSRSARTCSAWLRNCCLDELGRQHTDSVALHLLHPVEEPPSAAPSPHDAMLDRDDTLTALADVADLPASQRHALVRRELDGLTHEELARELGTSVAATKNLVFRARENLARAAEARDARCEDVRHDLPVAHDRSRRPSMRVLRHATLCKDCRAFRARSPGNGE